MPEGARIYNLFPLLAGTVEQWKKHLDRIAAMGFDWVFLNSFHQPGFSGSLYSVRDYYRLNPLFQGASKKTPEALLEGFVAKAAKRGLSVMMDLVVNHTAIDCPWVESHPDWYRRDAEGGVRRPSVADPDDPSKITVWGDLAEIDYSPRPAREAVVEEWRRMVRHYAALGFRGFRCDAAYKVPAEVWRQIAEAAREVGPNTVFAAETLGCRPEEVEALAPAGFDYLFNSSKWWDFRADWLFEQYDRYRRVAPTISFPESHDTERLATELSNGGNEAPDRLEAHYRQRYVFAAAFSTGVMMPVGYEYGFRRRLDVVRTRPSDWEEPRFDLGAFIAEVNAMKAAEPALNEEGPQGRLPGMPEGTVALLRRARDGAAAVLTLVNADAGAHRKFAEDSVTRQGLDLDHAREITPARPPDVAMPLIVEPLGARLFRLGDAADARHEVEPTAFPQELRSRPIVIQNVCPEVDCGKWAVKREVGDTLEVWADIVTEGHDKVAAVLKWRAFDEPRWREVPMSLENPGLDRWRGAVRLERNAAYLYTIEAWRDAFESWRDEVEKKVAAGQDVTLELIEGRQLLDAARDRAGGDDAASLPAIVADLDAAPSSEARAAVMLSDTVRGAMRRCPDRSAAVDYDHVLAVFVDRIEARYAAWYEMFPRSQGTVPGRSATFRDCERRLPEIREMGFDVVYFVPIHPIGRTHRKGRNNVVAAAPDDPGSPYAIGSEEGGHTAVHPELGTIHDFDRLVEAARRLGMEVALDFAIQCAPDHPWIKEHPEWFRFRPDGTIKYAENPPKKYQDIVNVDFYGPAWRELWQALLDVVLFWVGHGVKIFRVDNPHTKPIPFWEWLIREVRRRHPDVIFLSEAFTRPPMLKLLAKVGFSQSYTYFTWRNFKGELIDYLTELTQSDCKEYLRPNLFANTPDINPPYLQTGGRPAHQVRLVLAATLSPAYGIYNGFELCEATPIPGKEEYLNSEKYEYKVWDWDRPGNIKDYISRVNRIRCDNPALHEFESLRFYPADDDNVIFYGKMTADRSNMIFIAVNLDPFDAHAAEIEFPLDTMGILEGEKFEVEELLSAAKHLWQGARQRIRLDPASNPAAIFRVTPWARVDFQEPCF